MRANDIENMFYTPGEYLDWEQVVVKAWIFMGAMWASEDEGCYDYWFGLAENWDLNLWLDVDDPNYKDEDISSLRASLYHVNEKGETDFNTFRRIYPLT